MVESHDLKHGGLPHLKLSFSYEVHSLWRITLAAHDVTLHVVFCVLTGIVQLKYNPVGQVTTIIQVLIKVSAIFTSLIQFTSRYWRRLKIANCMHE
jgi:hypothetical protein